MAVVVTRPVVWVWLVGVGVLTPIWVCAQNQANTLIVLHTDNVTGSVSPLIFGASHPGAARPGDVADPESGLTYPLTVEQIKDVGISLISYPGGRSANSFQWQRAVGPKVRRAQQVRNPLSASEMLDSGFGPDEFGDLLEQTGAVGDLAINFGTASADDAANYVAYMTGPVGSALVNGVDWASRRAANRHPKPYRIGYVRIGNDYALSNPASTDQNSWINGDPASINPACAADRISCLYAFGGSTHFERQPAVQLSDWSESASVSSGESGQTMYARYSPVAAGTETVWVDGKSWHGVSDLSASAADAKVYRISYPSGAINFGNGTHGTIPPKGTKVTISYTSGPHEGFVDFYRTIKAVNPSIKVCASIAEESFIRIMGAQHAYDCIQQRPHPVATQAPAPGDGLDEYFARMAANTVKLGAEVQRMQQLVKKYAGANARWVDLVVSEYGRLAAYPAGAAYFGRGAGQAVLNALCLREWVLAGVAAAARASLVDHASNPIPQPSVAVALGNAEPTEDLALFAGPGPHTIVTPLALSIKLLRMHTGETLLASSIEGSPIVSASPDVSMDALQAYATRDAAGNAYLVVINVDPQHDIAATIRSDGGRFGPVAEVTTLASHDLNDESNPRNPPLMSLNKADVAIDAASIELSFPKHSVTGIKLTATK